MLEPPLLLLSSSSLRCSLSLSLLPSIPIPCSPQWLVWVSSRSLCSPSRPSLAAVSPKYVLDTLSVLTPIDADPTLNYQDPAEEADGAEAPKHIAVTAQASFPESEIFGVKIVNGQPAHAQVTFTNEESSPIAVNFIGGALWDLDEERSQNVRNLTTSRYSVEIPAGQKESLSYTFATEMHPQDLRLQLSSIVTAEDNMYNIVAYNSTVSVVEPKTSIFDPQM